jgi:hypothetical protein
MNDAIDRLPAVSVGIAIVLVALALRWGRENYGRIKW